MSDTKKLEITKFGVWSFVLAWFGFMLISMGILAVIFGVIGLNECLSGKKRGIGWPIAGLIFGGMLLAVCIGSWESYASFEGVWIMNIASMLTILGIYALARKGKKKKDKVIPQEKSTVPSASVTPASGSSQAAVKPAILKKPAQAAVKPAAPQTSANTYPTRAELKKQADERAAVLQEKLLKEEANRLREEEENEQRRQTDAAQRKEFRMKILEQAAAEPPAEQEILTLDGQRLLYKYAAEIFPPQPDSEAARFLMRETIEDAETMIGTVSGVMEALSERILECSDSELEERWENLGREDIIQGIKAFSFYKEMSVGSEPFELITDKLIDYLYAKEENQDADR